MLLKLDFYMLITQFILQFQTGFPTCEAGDTSNSASSGRKKPSVHNDSPAANTANDEQGAVVRIQ